jgi:Flp pilus assembly protein TadB
MVSPLVAAVAAIAIIGGLFLIAAGLRKVPIDATSAGTATSATLARLTGLHRRWTRRTRILIVVGLAVGVVAALVKGWIVAVVVAPAACAGIPALLDGGEQKDVIVRLKAMEGWVRALANGLAAGIGLEQAIRRSLKSCPQAIRPEVTTLVSRLQDWPTGQALRAFADDLNDATGDLIVSSQLLAAERRGRGLTEILNGLATTVAEEVKIRESIEADRAKPRTIARTVTLLSLIIVGGLLLFSGSYVEPYGTPIGQPILAALIGAFAGALLWMKRMARGTPTPRFLPASKPGGGRA